MAKKINTKEIEGYLLNIKRLTPEYLFGSISPSVRQGILDDCFNHFSGFKLTKWGLAMKNNPNGYHYKDYTNYKHIESIEGLVWDINYTNSLKKSQLHQIQRKVFALKEKRRKAHEFKLEAKKIITNHKKKWNIKPEQSRIDRINESRNNASQEINFER